MRIAPAGAAFKHSSHNVHSSSSSGLTTNRASSTAKISTGQTPAICWLNAGDKASCWTVICMNTPTMLLPFQVVFFDSFFDDLDAQPRRVPHDHVAAFR